MLIIELCVSTEIVNVSSETIRDESIQMATCVCTSVSHTFVDSVTTAYLGTYIDFRNLAPGLSQFERHLFTQYS